MPAHEKLTEAPSGIEIGHISDAKVNPTAPAPSDGEVQLEPDMQTPEVVESIPTQPFTRFHQTRWSAHQVIVATSHRR